MIRVSLRVARMALGVALACITWRAEARVVTPETASTAVPQNLRVVSDAAHDTAVRIDWTARRLRVACQAQSELPFYAPETNASATEQAARVQGTRALEVALGALTLPAAACAQPGACTVGSVLACDPWARERVQQALLGATAVRSRYCADGHVALELELALDGPQALGAVWLRLGQGALAPAQPAAITSSAQPYTSVVFDAAHLPLEPRLFVRVVDEADRTLYAARQVAPEALAARGQVIWAVSREAAQRDDRIQDRPLVVRVKELVGEAQDLRVDDPGGILARDAASLFAQARVAIVVAAPQPMAEP